MQTETTTTTTPAPKPDAQPVQAAKRTAHTPAPWMRNGDWIYGAPGSGAAQGIAQVLGNCGCTAAVEANARLIAAAPALLAALEAIHEAGRMSSQPRAVYCALLAEDALEAAKGGAQ